MWSLPLGTTMHVCANTNINPSRPHYMSPHECWQWRTLSVVYQFWTEKLGKKNFFCVNEENSCSLVDLSRWTELIVLIQIQGIILILVCVDLWSTCNINWWDSFYSFISVHRLSPPFQHQLALTLKFFFRVFFF